MTENIFPLLYFIGIIAETAIRLPHYRRYKKNRIADDRINALERFLLFLASLGMFFLPLIYVLTPWLDGADYHIPLWAGLVGVFLLVLAVWLFQRAHTDLGQNWSASLQVMEGHEVVTGGVYSYIRHPMYASQWLWGIAQVFLLQNWIAGFATLVLFLPLYLLRIPREEQMMLDHFGEEYRLYINRTGRITPRFRRQQKFS
jgi:protein-S-isoprenylcysteine O-methyltransferase Ste14